MPHARALVGRIFEALATLHEAALVHGGLAPRNSALATYRRAEQESLFEAALAWVRADRPLLPTDVVHTLARELTVRVD